MYNNAIFRSIQLPGIVDHCWIKKWLFLSYRLQHVTLLGVAKCNEFLSLTVNKNCHRFILRTYNGRNSTNMWKLMVIISLLCVLIIVTIKVFNYAVSVKTHTPCTIERDKNITIDCIELKTGKWEKISLT
jgi:cytochrome bd-type quinol oxidase subunit 2